MGWNGSVIKEKIVGVVAKQALQCRENPSWIYGFEEGMCECVVSDSSPSSVHSYNPGLKRSRFTWEDLPCDLFISRVRSKMQVFVRKDKGKVKSPNICQKTQSCWRHVFAFRGLYWLKMNHQIRMPTPGPNLVFPLIPSKNTGTFPHFYHPLYSLFPVFDF